MSLNKITSSELRTLIPIVERKERLQEELAEIESKLSTYLSPEPVRRGLRRRLKPGESASANLPKSEFLSQRSKKAN